MATESYQVQLERVQASIAKIESGAQVYQRGDRSLTRASLPALYERERWLRRMAEREATGGGIRVRLATPVP